MKDHNSDMRLNLMLLFLFGYVLYIYYTLGILNSKIMFMIETINKFCVKISF